VAAWHDRGIVIAFPPYAADIAAVHPRPDGDVLVIPHVLPLRIPREALTLTVSDWLGLTDAPVT
jgi:hypothetical protein